MEICKAEDATASLAHFGAVPIPACSDSAKHSGESMA